MSTISVCKVAVKHFFLKLHTCAECVRAFTFLAYRDMIGWSYALGSKQILIIDLCCAPLHPLSIPYPLREKSLCEAMSKPLFRPLNFITNSS